MVLFRSVRLHWGLKEVTVEAHRRMGLGQRGAEKPLERRRRLLRARFSLSRPAISRPSDSRCAAKRRPARPALRDTRPPRRQPDAAKDIRLRRISQLSRLAQTVLSAEAGDPPKMKQVSGRKRPETLLYFALTAPTRARRPSGSPAEVRLGIPRPPCPRRDDPPAA